MQRLEFITHDVIATNQPSIDEPLAKSSRPEETLLNWGDSKSPFFK
jgi:hypothetical protein